MAFWDRKRQQAPEEGTADGGPKSLLAVLRSWDGAARLAGLDGDALPGAADAAWVLGPRRPPVGEDEEEETLLVPLRMACRNASEANFEALYAASRPTHLAPCWESLVERFRATKAMSRDATTAVARRLRQRAADVEPAKLGLLLTTALLDRDALDDVATYARHEEFSFWVVLAMGALSSQATDDLWAYAKAHRGWGRVHAARRLVPEAGSRPELADWLLREGTDTTAGLEHVALLCAKGCRLDEALAAPTVDDALLDGAARLLAYLFSPVERDASYARWPAAPRAARDYLRLVAGRTDSGLRRAAIEAIHATVTDPSFLGGGPPEDPRARDAWLERRLALEDAGWAPEVAQELAAACEAATA